MMLFNNVKPRRFSLPPVYSDERKERLRGIEERARRELGQAVPGASGRADLHGVFTDRCRHLRRTGDSTSGIAMISRIAIIVALLLLASLIAGHILL